MKNKFRESEQELYVINGDNFAERQMKKLGWKLSIDNAISTTDSGDYKEFVKFTLLS